MTLHPDGRVNIPPGLWSGLREAGLDPGEVALRAGLPETGREAASVTTDQYLAIWQAYSDLADDPAAAIVELATRYDPAKYPPAVMAAYHARDYRDALQRMVRYKRMCPPEELRMTEKGEHCVIELGWRQDGINGPPLLAGATLAWLLELGRRGTGQHITARQVEFAQPTGNLGVLAAYFGCVVRVGERNRITLARSDLDRPFLSYNEEMLEILTPALNRSLEEKQRLPSLSEKVAWMIRRSLAGGVPSLPEVARSLGMSSRTLQRRLTEERLSFKQLLHQTRHEQARRYLADPRIHMKEVAFLIGYEDQNSFYRAFREWEGSTPSRWRSVHASDVSTD
ncbi:AraC family transcriptional regulator ligand-binding domain-containing protein [Paenibacillus sp. 1P07SE]|uniref:AraC family transcriptional regulator ligand-binding domain-containing protein n=1 Tax=Paenibacillus sp. 1P07SE TaxID=3132209 RepID=UPI0039A4450D